MYDLEEREIGRVTDYNGEWHPRSEHLPGTGEHEFEIQSTVTMKAKWSGYELITELWKVEITFRNRHYGEELSYPRWRLGSITIKLGWNNLGGASIQITGPEETPWAAEALLRILADNPNRQGKLSEDWQSLV